MNKIASIEHLSYSYDDERLALEDVSFSLSEGKRYALIGHNGSGKSTLAKCLMGLTDRFEGRITIFGFELSRKTIRDIRSRVGIVFQNPDNQFVGSTVADDIAFGLENKRVPREEMQSLIEHFSKEAGMEGLLDREPSSLSGGQKQRVAIAGVLAMGPDLIILDEATSMLDPRGKREILSLIRKLQNENPKLTILSITHDVEEAAQSDEVLVLNEGKLVLQGTPDEVFSRREELHALHLGLPFFYELRHALALEGIAVSESVKDLDGLEDFLCR